MAELSTLARPYARAAFDTAKERKKLEGWSTMLRALATVVSLPAVKALVDNASLTASDKVARLADLCKEDVADGGQSFLEVLAENGRLALLPAIFEQFETLRLAESHTEDVLISSAFPLNDEQVSLLQDKLAKRLGQSVTVSTEVDSSLKAGVIIRYGDTVIDGSARGRLHKLAEAMNS